MAKTASAKYVTKMGTFVFPHINTPDTKFNKDGVYHLKFRQSKELARELAALCKRVAQEQWGPAKAKGANMPYKVDEEDKDSIVLSAKAKALYPPYIADHQGKRVDRADLPTVGTGTSGKLDIRLVTNEVKGELYVSCYLQGVQIVKLVEYNGSAFGAVEEDELGDDDGFTAASDRAGAVGTLVTEASANAVSGEYEDDEDELVDTDEDDDF